MSEVALKPDQDILKPSESNQDAIKAPEPLDLSPSSAMEVEASSPTPIEELGNDKNAESVSDSSPDILAGSGNEVIAEVAKENGIQDMEFAKKLASKDLAVRSAHYERDLLAHQLKCASQERSALRAQLSALADSHRQLVAAAHVMQQESADLRQQAAEAASIAAAAQAQCAAAQRQQQHLVQMLRLTQQQQQQYQSRVGGQAAYRPSAGRPGSHFTTEPLSSVGLPYGVAWSSARGSVDMNDFIHRSEVPASRAAVILSSNGSAHGDDDNDSTAGIVAGLFDEEMHHPPPNAGTRAPAPDPLFQHPTTAGLSTRTSFQPKPITQSVDMAHEADTAAAAVNTVFARQSSQAAVAGQTGMAATPPGRPAQLQVPELGSIPSLSGNVSEQADHVGEMQARFGQHIHSISSPGVRLSHQTSSGEPQSAHSTTVGVGGVVRRVTLPSNASAASHLGTAGNASSGSLAAVSELQNEPTSSALTTGAKNSGAATPRHASLKQQLVGLSTCSSMRHAVPYSRSGSPTRRSGLGSNYASHSALATLVGSPPMSPVRGAASLPSGPFHMGLRRQHTIGSSVVTSPTAVRGSSLLPAQISVGRETGMQRLSSRISDVPDTPVVYSSSMDKQAGNAGLSGRSSMEPGTAVTTPMSQGGNSLSTRASTRPAANPPPRSLVDLPPGPALVRPLDPRAAAALHSELASGGISPPALGSGAVPFDLPSYAHRYGLLHASLGESVPAMSGAHPAATTTLLSAPSGALGMSGAPPHAASSTNTNGRLQGISGTSSGSITPGGKGQIPALRADVSRPPRQLRTTVTTPRGPPAYAMMGHVLPGRVPGLRSGQMTPGSIGGPLLGGVLSENGQQLAHALLQTGALRLAPYQSRAEENLHLLAALESITHERRAAIDAELDYVEHSDGEHQHKVKSQALRKEGSLGVVREELPPSSTQQQQSQEESTASGPWEAVPAVDAAMTAEQDQLKQLKQELAASKAQAAAAEAEITRLRTAAGTAMSTEQTSTGAYTTPHQQAHAQHTTTLPPAPHKQLPPRPGAVATSHNNQHQPTPTVSKPTESGGSLETRSEEGTVQQPTTKGSAEPATFTFGFPTQRSGSPSHISEAVSAASTDEPTHGLAGINEPAATQQLLADILDPQIAAATSPSSSAVHMLAQLPPSRKSHAANLINELRAIPASSASFSFQKPPVSVLSALPQMAEDVPYPSTGSTQLHEEGDQYPGAWAFDTQPVTSSHPLFDVGFSASETSTPAHSPPHTSVDLSDTMRYASNGSSAGQTQSGAYQPSSVHQPFTLPQLAPAAPVEYRAGGTGSTVSLASQGYATAAVNTGESRANNERDMDARQLQLTSTGSTSDMDVRMSDSAAVAQKLGNMQDTGAADQQVMTRSLMNMQYLMSQTLEQMRAMQDQLRINGSALLQLQEQQQRTAKRVETLETKTT